MLTNQQIFDIACNHMRTQGYYSRNKHDSQGGYSGNGCLCVRGKLSKYDQTIPKMLDILNYRKTLSDKTRENLVNHLECIYEGYSSSKYATKFTYDFLSGKKSLDHTKSWEIGLQQLAKDYGLIYTLKIKSVEVLKYQNEQNEDLITC